MLGEIFMKRKVKKLVSGALASIMVLSSVLMCDFSASAVITDNGESSVGVMVDNAYDVAMQSDGIIYEDDSAGGKIVFDNATNDPVIEPTEPESTTVSPETQPATEPQPSTTEPQPSTTEPQPSTEAPSLALKTSSRTLGVNEKYTLETEIVGIPVSALVWSNSNESVLTVSKSGANVIVTAKKTGTSTVTVKANGMSAECVFTVKAEPTSMSLNKTSIILGVGESYDLDSSLPKGCGAYSILYSTNNAAVADVKAAGGIVTAKSVGTATVTATAYNGVKVSCKVEVRNAPTYVTLNKSSIALGTGTTFTLEENTPGAYSNPDNVVWSSSDSSVASVKKDYYNTAVVTAKKAGTAIITIKTYNGLTAQCKVSVENVGTVKNITKTSFESTSVTLKWDKVSGATGYVIYYLNADNHKNFSKIKEVTSNAATISDLRKTTQYHFKVAAYVEKNGVRYEGAPTIKKTCTQAAEITNLTLDRSSDVIELSWSRVTNATGYKIYRACEKTDWDYVAYKTLKGNSNTTLTEKNMPTGNQFRYKIVAYRLLYGDCYYYSKGVTKVAYAGLGAPTVNVVSRLRKANLTWSRNKYATGYEIYYSKNNKNNFSKLGTTTNTFFNTHRLEAGKIYYFRVRPYRTLTVNGKRTNVPGTYFTYSVKATSTAYGQSIGNTYIEISIKEQRMWFYKNGEYILDTYVVTGNDDGYHNTPTGVYSIWQRMSPATLVGADYSTRVSYWLAFTYSGCGIHDASWRSDSEYGGTTYKGNGSHGCVNTPYNKVRTIYNNVGIGTKVVLY